MDSFSVIRTNASLPTPTVEDSLGELVESTYIQLENLVVSRASGNGDHVFEAIKGADTISFLVNSVTDVDDSLSRSPLKVGDTICSIAGMVSQNDSVAPYLENYYMIPLFFSTIDTTSCQLVGLEQNHQDELEVKIYPNPTSANVTIEIRDYEGEVEISILSSSGKQVYHETVYLNRKETIKENVSPGTYVVRLVLDNGVNKHFKLIKTP